MVNRCYTYLFLSKLLSESILDMVTDKDASPERILRVFDHSS